MSLINIHWALKEVFLFLNQVQLLLKQQKALQIIRWTRDLLTLSARFLLLTFCFCFAFPHLFLYTDVMNPLIKYLLPLMKLKNQLPSKILQVTGRMSSDKFSWQHTSHTLLFSVATVALILFAERSTIFSLLNPRNMARGWWSEGFFGNRKRYFRYSRHINNSKGKQLKMYNTCAFL